MRICLAALLAVSGIACSNPAPKSVDELTLLRDGGELEIIGAVRGGKSYDAQLAAYEVDGMRLQALIATPKGEAPVDGYPVLIANHGTHPDPPMYGISADGLQWRPGDYYRPVPEAYAERGFLVVMPDYRGHNTSEGAEFAHGFLASAYYTEDVLALLPRLAQIEGADTNNVFMWGHSLGGEVSLRALVSTDKVRAATIWSTVGGDIWDQAYHYSRYQEPLAADGADIDKPSVTELRGDIARLGVSYDWRAREPLQYLDRLTAPLIIHHAVGDRGAAYKWSVRLAKELYMIGHPYEFFSYEGDDHFFTGDQFRMAVDRDVEFFRSKMID